MTKKEIFDVGSMVKINQEQLRRCGHNLELAHNEEIYTISKVLRVNSDNYKLIELDRCLTDSLSNIINTFYLRLLTPQEIRKLKLNRINESRR